MTTSELRTAIATLGLSQEALGRFLGHSTGRTVRRWLAEEQPIPKAVAMLLHLMVRHSIGINDVKQ